MTHTLAVILVIAVVVIALVALLDVSRKGRP